MLIFHKLDSYIGAAKALGYSMAGGSLFAAITIERIGATWSYLTAAIPGVLGVITMLIGWYLSRVRDVKQWERQEEYDSLKSTLEKIAAVAEIEGKAGGPLSREMLLALIRGLNNGGDNAGTKDTPAVAPSEPPKG